jgi:hypothetical protein
VKPDDASEKGADSDAESERTGIPEGAIVSEDDRPPPASLASLGVSGSTVKETKAMPHTEQETRRAALKPVPVASPPTPLPGAVDVIAAASEKPKPFSVSELRTGNLTPTPAPPTPKLRPGGFALRGRSRSVAPAQRPYKRSRSAPPAVFDALLPRARDRSIPPLPPRMRLTAENIAAATGAAPVARAGGRMRTPSQSVFRLRSVSPISSPGVKIKKRRRPRRGPSVSSCSASQQGHKRKEKRRKRGTALLPALRGRSPASPSALTVQLVRGRPSPSHFPTFEAPLGRSPAPSVTPAPPSPVRLKRRPMPSESVPPQEKKRREQKKKKEKRERREKRKRAASITASHWGASPSRATRVIERGASGQRVSSEPLPRASDSQPVPNRRISGSAVDKTPDPFTHVSEPAPSEAPVPTEVPPTDVPDMPTHTRDESEPPPPGAIGAPAKKRKKQREAKSVTSPHPTSPPPTSPPPEPRRRRAER